MANRSDRSNAVVLLALALGLTACGQPAPDRNTPRPRPASDHGAVPAAPVRSSEAPQRPLLQAINSAADLFNRGENDLACEQVQRALALQNSATAPLPQHLQSQLETFRRACPAS
jgi:hypothetical protein